MTEVLQWSVIDDPGCAWRLRPLGIFNNILYSKCLRHGSEWVVMAVLELEWISEPCALFVSVTAGSLGHFLVGSKAHRRQLLDQRGVSDEWYSYIALQSRESYCSWNIYACNSFTILGIFVSSYTGLSKIINLNPSAQIPQLINAAERLSAHQDSTKIDPSKRLVHKHHQNPTSHNSLTKLPPVPRKISVQQKGTKTSLPKHWLPRHL